MTQRIDRRRFLLGAGAAALAVPVLRSLSPRTAFAQDPVPPKRLVVVMHGNGRIVGNGGGGGDWWSPGSASGALPSGAPSRMLAPLAEIRDEIVTVDGIDNVVRHASGDIDGHGTSGHSILRCSLDRAPSFDHVVGTRLRASSAMRASIVIPASATPEGVYFQDGRFAGEGGSDCYAVSGNPQQAIEQVFGPPSAGGGSEPPPERPSLRDRLTASRRSLLDGVVGELTSLRGRVDARDREQLDRHADFIRTLETRLGGGGPAMLARGCARPDETTAPHVYPSNWSEYVENGGRNSEWERGRQDPLTTPFQIETLVQSLACDVTRAACLVFQGDPAFTSEFPGGSPFESDDSFHSTIHGVPRIAESMSDAADCERGFLQWARMFTLLVERLAEIEDTDGSRLLDNTLVLWISELGYGSEHTNHNLPVVLAGLGTAFTKGRHIVERGKTTGDLYAHLLRLLGGSDATFGPTGTLGDLASARGVSALYPELGRPGAITRSTPLHGGPLSL
jgi:hypothetical protein